MVCYDVEVSLFELQWGEVVIRGAKVAKVEGGSRRETCEPICREIQLVIKLERSRLEYFTHSFVCSRVVLAVLNTL